MQDDGTNVTQYLKAPHTLFGQFLGRNMLTICFKNLMRVPMFNIKLAVFCVALPSTDFPWWSSTCWQLLFLFWSFSLWRIPRLVYGHQHAVQVQKAWNKQWIYNVHMCLSPHIPDPEDKKLYCRQKCNKKWRFSLHVCTTHLVSWKLIDIVMSHGCLKSMNFIQYTVFSNVVLFS